MSRLLAGRPKLTDGRLTKANLGREAGVSHATLHRAKSILRDWDAAVEQTRQPTPEQAQHRQATDTLRTELDTKTRQVAQLRERLEAAGHRHRDSEPREHRTASPTRQARHRGAHRSPECDYGDPPCIVVR